MVLVPLSFWQTPVGGVALNLIASLLWDGGTSFSRLAKSVAKDHRELATMAGEIKRRTDHQIEIDRLREWLNDDEIWVLLAETGRDDNARIAAASRLIETHFPEGSIEVGASILSVVLVEVSRRDSTMRTRLDSVELRNRFDVIEVSLGYVMSELLTEAIVTRRELGGELDAVNKKLDQIIAELDAQESDKLEAELRRLAALAADGVLIKEAAIELQIRTYLKATGQWQA